MDTSSVVSKTVKIPVGDIELNGKFILPKYTLNENNKPITKLPLIVLGHSWGMSLSGISTMLLMEYVIPLDI